ncbi:hypothetical protein BV25DRAFT_1045863 [Artomyces pyxidatus]|uniref:Uncharacterized protein n=1 Tax=Artomyces pyxidatus TaxID=48021 RepID=A0ACB8STB2_9AGAM|nr:hypothetical protein BV25DRAFT_1045863 [Artomyces pyxidatus]
MCAGCGQSITMPSPRSLIDFRSNANRFLPPKAPCVVRRLSHLPQSSCPVISARMCVNVAARSRFPSTLSLRCAFGRARAPSGLDLRRDCLLACTPPPRLATRVCVATSSTLWNAPEHSLPLLQLDAPSGPLTSGPVTLLHWLFRRRYTCEALSA